MVSGSDDSSVKLWDIRQKRAVKTFENNYQVTAVCFSSDNSQVIAGGLDGDIKVQRVVVICCKPKRREY